MLRIRLGVDDLSRLQLAAGGVAGLIEAVYSSVALRAAETALWYGDLRQRLLPLVGAESAPLFELFRSQSELPAFMIKRTNDPEVFAEHLLSLPTARIQAELSPTGAYARRLRSGDREARRQLAGAVTGYHRALSDTLPAIRSLAHADLAHRGSLLASQGLGALLDSLHPLIRWRSPVLEVDVATNGELELAGRTLELTPSVFIRARPGVLAESERVYITYPVRGSRLLGGGGGGGNDDDDPLADVLGRTRSVLLRALHAPGTTTELADRLGVSLASVSGHATVLRRAGLITTRREGRAVRHRLTALGHSVLAASPPRGD